jgi:hypothetical protein
MPLKRLASSWIIPELHRLSDYDYDYDYDNDNDNKDDRAAEAMLSLFMCRMYHC